MYKNSLKCYCLLMIGMVFCGIVGASSNVYADGGSGGGGGGESSYNEKACTDGPTSAAPCAKGGGYNWRIFKTGTKANKNGIFTDAGIQPTYNTSLSVLQNGGYDKKISSTCPSSQYAYYIALVRNGTGPKLGTYYGPLAYGTETRGKQNSNEIVYDSKAALDTLVKSNTVTPGAAVSGGVVKAACKEINSGPCASYSSGDFPKTLGYLCYKVNANTDPASAYVYGYDIDTGQPIEPYTRYQYGITESAIRNDRSRTSHMLSLFSQRYGYAYDPNSSSDRSRMSNLIEREAMNDMGGDKYDAKELLLLFNQCKKYGKNTYPDGTTNLDQIPNALFEYKGRRCEYYEIPESTNKLLAYSTGYIGDYMSIRAPSTYTNHAGKKYYFTGRWSGCPDVNSGDTTECSFSAAQFNVFNAYYATPKIVTAYAIDELGNRIGGPIKVEVGQNESKDISISGFGIGSNYLFKWWESGNYCSNDSYSTCRIGPIAENKTIYARYYGKRTLTAYAKDIETGALLNGGKPIASSTGWYKDKVSVNNNYNVEGYTWSKWDNNAYCANSTARTCTANSLTSNATVYALFQRNYFGGRTSATVNGTVVADTGYVEGDSSRSANVDSTNNGLTVDFGVYLRETKGRGPTYYSTNTSVIAGKTSPYTPSASGDKVGQATATIKPGQQACRKITFRPYGKLANSVVKTATACVTAKVTTFEANVSVTGASSAGGGWFGSSKTTNVYVDNCSAASGCKVSFKHDMRRTGSIGSTGYTVTRTSNLPRSTNARGIDGATLGTGTFNSSSARVKEDNNLTLYPGMVVCEKINFKPNNDYRTNNTVDVQTCVFARGNAQPNEPSNPDTPEDDPGSGKLNGDGAFVNIKVRNIDVARWTKYQRSVWAKPNDKLAFRASYNPVLQYTYGIKTVGNGTLKGVLINGGNRAEGDGRTIGALFNSKVDPDWNNSFSIYKGSNFVNNHKYAAGLTDRQSPTANVVTVQPSDVGSEINETATTSDNRQASTRTTPSQVTFASDYGNVQTGSKSKTAHAYIPYNFIIETKITSPEPDDKDDNGVPAKPIYAGEDTSISYEVSVNPKTNQYTTDGSTNQAYTTNVKDSRDVLVVYYPSNVAKKGGGTMDGGVNANVCASYFGYSGSDSAYCSAIQSNTKNLTPGSHSTTKTFFTQDLPAGSEVCVASAAFPATSGADTNWNNTNYDGKWRVSDSKCYKIAKRPSLQAWGGNVFSAAAINAQRAVKHNLKGYSSYNINAVEPQKTWVFGSWGELGVVSQKMITGFGSGATLGFASNSNGVLSPSLSPNPPEGNTVANTPNAGGSNDASFCRQSVLTFTNSPCSSSSSSINGSDGKDATDSINANIASIESLAGINEKGEFISSNIKYQDITESNFTIDGGMISGMDDKTVLYRKTGDLVVEGGNLLRGTFKVVVATGNIRITKDIMIEGGETFENFRQVPKAVVYSNDTIAIDCGVKRLDAILVAKNRVVTCGDNLNLGEPLGKQIVAKINSRANSNQLVVNGAILTGRLYANRTYGAAAGANSIVPAEVINFDPTLYLWGGIGDTGEDNDTNGNANMEVTYIHELAPRY